MAQIASQSPTNGGERTCMYIQISEQVPSRSTVANRAVHSPTRRMGFIPRVTPWLIG
jgi:hypothetical protein